MFPKFHTAIRSFSLSESVLSMYKLPHMCCNRLLQSRKFSIFKKLRNNKSGLSFALDSTMRDGHHDMKLFGLGFLRSISHPVEQAHTLKSLSLAYSALEESLDSIGSHTRAAKFWKIFKGDLRKAQSLKLDIEIFGGFSGPTLAAEKYAAAIYAAAYESHSGLSVQGGSLNQDEDESRGDLLLAHAYVRYLADLFGGSFLGRPTQLAFSLKGPPNFYYLNNRILMDRKSYINAFYKALNEAGQGMDEERQHKLVLEARRAYKYNAEIYKERPHLYVGAIKGASKIAVGIVRERLGF